MRPLTLDDIMPLGEFAGRRREFFHALGRYLDRYRRVRIGPQVTLVFENRQTLWFKVQDILRVCRLADQDRIQEELDLYNQLLPGRNCLQAALIIQETLDQMDRGWESLRGEDLRLFLGKRNLAAQLLTSRPEDRAAGAAHWIQFTFGEEDRTAFANFRVPARFSLAVPFYTYESPLLDEDVRQSLIEDLNLSDRD